jgi:hypothetical protein
MTTDRKVHTVVKSKSLSRNRLTLTHRPGLFEPSVGRAVAGRHCVTDNGGGGAELAERGYRGVVTPITDCRRRSGTVKTLPQPRTVGKQGHRGRQRQRRRRQGGSGTWWSDI